MKGEVAGFCYLKNPDGDEYDTCDNCPNYLTCQKKGVNDDNVGSST